MLFGSENADMDTGVQQAGQVHGIDIPGAEAVHNQAHIQAAPGSVTKGGCHRLADVVVGIQIGFEPDALLRGRYCIQ